MSNKAAPFLLPILFIVLGSAESALADSLAQYGAFSSNGFAGGVFTTAICDLYSLVQGEMGGMLMSASALCALAAAAMGNTSQFITVIVVGVGAYGLSAGVSLYFGNFNC